MNLVVLDRGYVFSNYLFFIIIESKKFFIYLGKAAFLEVGRCLENIFKFLFFIVNVIVLVFLIDFIYKKRCLFVCF